MEFESGGSESDRALLHEKFFGELSSSRYSFFLILEGRPIDGAKAEAD